MKKLIVVIPAFNEEKTIEKVIHDIPSAIAGVEKIEIIVVDDGSTDQTPKIAKKNGAVVISHLQNFGLATAFKNGLEKALEMGADIIVNTDADFQYDQKQIPLLIRPILEGKADLVLGSRFKGWIESMPFQKKIGNILATKAVQLVSGIPLSDAQTGFRAFSREAALCLNVLSRFTYTQETIIQASYLKLRIVEVPIHFKKRADQSRLISNILDYAKKSAFTVLMGYLTYKPLRFFLGIGCLVFAGGAVVGLSVLLHFFRFGVVTPHLPSAILSVALLLFGFQLIAIGIVAEMIKNNRQLAEETLYRIKKKQFEKKQ